MWINISSLPHSKELLGVRPAFVFVTFYHFRMLCDYFCESIAHLLPAGSDQKV